MNPSALKILVVDDDATFTKAASIALRDQAEVHTANSLSEFKAQFESCAPFDVVITDYRMNLGDGHMVLEHARRINPDIPVIIVTAFACKDMAIKSINLAAFALMEKPIDLAELSDAVARAAKKRPVMPLLSAIDEHREIVSGPFTLRPLNFTLTYDGQEYQVTETEFRILQVLIKAEKQRISREVMVKEVWGGATISSNLFDTHLLNLRRKLPQLKSHLQVVRGKGFIFDSQRVC